MIKICPFCSNVNVNKIKEIVGEKNVKVGCIGQCRSFKKEAVGFINGELVIKENEELFLKEISK